MYNCPLLVLFGVVLKEPHPNNLLELTNEAEIELR